jgi:uncharacterized protein involved in response to NO
LATLIARFTVNVLIIALRALCLTALWLTPRLEQLVGNDIGADIAAFVAFLFVASFLLLCVAASRLVARAVQRSRRAQPE